MKDEPPQSAGGSLVSLLSLGGVSSPALGLDGSFVFPLGRGLDPAPAGSLSLEVRAWVWDQGSAVLGHGLSASLPLSP